MNFSATFLGLDNPKPLGIKAMEELQELNPVKDRASNAQIMFVVINNAGLTLYSDQYYCPAGSARSYQPHRYLYPYAAHYVGSHVSRHCGGSSCTTL
jgi:hypothetical protein